MVVTIITAEQPLIIIAEQPLTTQVSYNIATIRCDGNDVWAVPPPPPYGSPYAPPTVPRSAIDVWAVPPPLLLPFLLPFPLPYPQPPRERRCTRR